VAYEQVFFRAIHARRDALGWDAPRLYKFAAEKLGLKRLVTSLRELGTVQFESLAELIGCQKENTKS